MTNSPFATRLSSARKMKGWSLQKMADSLGEDFNKQLLNRLESGSQKPDAKQLISISSLFKLPTDFFMKPTKVELGSVDYRKTLKLNKTTQERVKEVASEYLERYLELEDLLGLDSEVSFKLKSIKITPNNHEQIEKAAEHLRQSVWKVGFDPLASIVRILEEHGIKVFAIDKLDDEILPDSFSGFSTIVNGKIGFIVFNNSETIPLVRRRFTLLHEFSHLYLDLTGLEEKEAERLCDSFAGSVLIPKQILINTFGEKRNSISPNELSLFKKQYGASLSAIMYRNKDAGIVSESNAKYFMIQYNRLYRKHEGKGYNGVENSDRFLQLLLRALAQEIISESKAASLNHMKTAQFRIYLDKMFDENSNY